MKTWCISKIIRTDSVIFFRVVSFSMKTNNTFVLFISEIRIEHPKVLVQNWWKDGQTQRKVKDAIEEELDQDLIEESYDRRLFKEKCDNVYELVVDFASNRSKWASAW